MRRSAAFGALAHTPFRLSQAKTTCTCDAVPREIAARPILRPAPSLPPLPPAPQPRRSLPTSAERRWLKDCDVRKGRSRAFIRSLAFTVRVNELVNAPPWAYLAHVRASKAVMGKRAVLRNRAKRRIRAAAANVMPAHAARECEYVFSVMPEACTLKFPQLVEEITAALKAADCYEECLPFESMRRRRGKRHRMPPRLLDSTAQQDEDVALNGAVNESANASSNEDEDVD